jgi:sterol desaturase/sphingolipid hydroxylase (fatty acid hydroxylase superfamily)
MPWGLIDLAILFVAFGALAKLTPCNPGQPAFLRRELADDALYWVLGALLYGGLATILIQGVAILVRPRDAAAITRQVLDGYGPASHLPLLLQAFLILVVMDVLQYWLHRSFHGRWLWPFHAVHHSAEQLDWTTTYRIHPVNFVVYSAGALAVTQLIGFSAAAFAILGPFNLVMGAMVHANLNWTFGPFRYVLASPVFHRWHHVRDPAVHDKNFAPTFPVLDLMFGTFHMPKGELPQSFGVDGAPTSFLAQLVYPFREIASQLGLGGKSHARAAAEPS